MRWSPRNSLHLRVFRPYDITESASVTVGDPGGGGREPRAGFCFVVQTVVYAPQRALPRLNAEPAATLEELLSLLNDSLDMLLPLPEPRLEAVYAKTVGAGAAAQPSTAAAARDARERGGAGGGGGGAGSGAGGSRMRDKGDGGRTRGADRSSSQYKQARHGRERQAMPPAVARKAAQAGSIDAEGDCLRASISVEPSVARYSLLSFNPPTTATDAEASDSFAPSQGSIDEEVWSQIDGLVRAAADGPDAEAAARGAEDTDALFGAEEDLPMLRSEEMADYMFVVHLSTKEETAAERATRPGGDAIPTTTVAI